MSEIIYLFMALLSLAAYALIGVALWAAVEGVYYVWCKIRGREY